MKRKLTFLNVVFTIILMVISGCSGNNQKSSGEANQKDQDSDKASTNSTDKPSYWSSDGSKIKIFMASNPSWPYSKDWPIWDWIKEKTNITVDGQPPSGKYADKLSLVMASGNLPDLFQIWAGDDSKYGQAGALVDLTKHLDKMPHLKKYWEENPEVKSRVTMPDGAVYLAVSEGASFSNQRAWQYREDIFKKNNLQPPSTWKELYQVSKKLKKLYPDSYPLVFRNGIKAFGNIAMSFGTTNGYYPDLETRKVKYGPIGDKFKKMVTWLNKFYEEGLIPPDWLSTNTEQWAQYVSTDKSFMTVDYIGRIQFLNAKFTEGKGRKMAYMKPPAGGGSQGYVPDAFYNREGLAIASTSKNQEAAFKYIDFLYSQEGVETLSWGEKGKTYTIENGKKKIKDSYNDFSGLRKETGIATYATYGYFNPKAAYSMMPDDEQKVYQLVPDTAYPEKIITPTFTKEERGILSVQGEAIKKQYEENVAKFIIGERPLSEWDQYVKEIKDLELQKVIDIYEKAWKRQGFIKE